MSPTISQFRSTSVRAFSLVELLSVMAIIALLAGLVIPAISQSDAKRFTSTVDDVATILEQARTSAMAKNTFVWVGLQPATDSGETGITVTAVSSRSGEADMATSNLMTLLPPRFRSRVVLDREPAAIPDTTSLGVGNLSFSQTWRGSQVTFTPVIQFNPRGEATILQGSQTRWLQFDLSAAKGGSEAGANKAAIRLNGFTGQVVVSRL
jgi:prepilin-type N-terminal cleavage/methylation domain-containing protein